MKKATLYVLRIMDPKIFVSDWSLPRRRILLMIPIDQIRKKGQLIQQTIKLIINKQKLQAEIASKKCRQKLQAEIASRNCKQKLQAEIASKNCKHKLQAQITSTNCKHKLQARFEFKTRQIMKLLNQKAKVTFFYFFIFLTETNLWLSLRLVKSVYLWKFCIPLTKHLFSLQLLISVTSNTISASGVWKDVIQSVIIQPLLDPLVSRKID